MHSLSLISHLASLAFVHRAVASSDTALSAASPVIVVQESPTASTTSQNTDSSQTLSNSSGHSHSTASPNITNWVPLGPGATEQAFFAPAAAFEEDPNSPYSQSPDNSSDASASRIKPLVMTYYSDWLSDVLPPEDIDYTLFDWIDWAFLLPTEHLAVTFDDAENCPRLLKRLVASAHASGSKVKASVGGWTGSRYFSSAVASEANRRTFANNIANVYRDYGLDGIDIDWEYPGRQGNGGNQVSPSDSGNFLEFLKVLRGVLPPTAVITAAVTTSPFTGPDGQPMKDVSTFVPWLNWITLMNYDTWGGTFRDSSSVQRADFDVGSSPPGPNAPLWDACGNSTQPGASAAGGYSAWTKAGFPAHKLVLGLPNYGYIISSTASRLCAREEEEPNQDTLVSSGAVKLTGDGGQVSVRDMLKQGALRSQRSKLVAAGGFTRFWDECSGTPYLRSTSAKQVVPYDDQQSIQMKAEFAKKTGLAGVNFWDAQGDTDDHILVKAARRGLGLDY
ncbi:hypothetical protein VNI00_001280 [Paramarasmius palmivorus]|uniref:GH18 domain-containing protein n=1 Tax=Paramarasmius palmivorus TaxID=297713 RepID=A0AAW0E669_9AGAR